MNCNSYGCPNIGGIPELYSWKSIDTRAIKEFLSKIKTPRFSKEHLELIDQCVLRSEVIEIIWDLECTKTPGSAGFSNEFYKSCPDIFLPRNVVQHYAVLKCHFKFLGKT